MNIEDQLIVGAKFQIKSSANTLIKLPIRVGYFTIIQIEPLGEDEGLAYFFYRLFDRRDDKIYCFHSLSIRQLIELGLLDLYLPNEKAK